MRAGHVGDAATTRTRKMFDGQDRAAFLVGDHAAVRVVRGAGERVDDRDRGLGEQRGTGLGAPAGHDDPVDAAAEQAAHVVLLADRVVAGVADERQGLRPAQRVLRAVQHRQAEPAVVVGHDQADGEGAPGEQAGRDRARDEAELFRGGLDAGAGLVAQLSAIVQRLGRRPDGDAGETGHVGDPGANLGFPWHDATLPTETLFLNPAH